MTGFSVLPLQIASAIGFAFVLFGMIALAFVVLNYLIRGGSVPGFTFLASMIAVFSGAQLFALGIFGEYLARIHFRSMDRPPYFVGESTACSEPTHTLQTEPRSAHAERVAPIGTEL
jgi:undecaprenyl-phosphate 4-deoxy-4-formamido-L-arabinose transferase